jgi:hypothetical protein
MSVEHVEVDSLCGKKVSCLCGHSHTSLSGYEIVKDFYKSGKKKGEVKKVRREYVTKEDGEEFISLHVERGFHMFDPDGMEYFLLMCPKCGNVQAVKRYE